MTQSRTIGKSSARRIKGIRKQLGMSQAQLANALSVNKNTVSRWERGDLVPPKLAELAAKYLLVTAINKEQAKHGQTKGKKS